MGRLRSDRHPLKSGTALWTIGILAAILTAIAPHGWADGGPAPRLVMDETSFHFQEVDEGTVLEHDFIVKNAGNQALEIKKVVPG